MLLSVISSVEADIAALGLESKELFLLAEIDEHPYPAELAATLSMPKATVTLYLKRLEAAGFVRREIDPADLRRHRLLLTPAGRQATKDGLAFLSDAFGKRLERLTGRSKTNSRSCSNKSSDTAPVPVFMRIPIGRPRRCATPSLPPTRRQAKTAAPHPFTLTQACGGRREHPQFHQNRDEPMTLM